MLEDLVAPSEIRYLAPGQLVATADPVTLRTVLGSCVAVCLHDAVLGVGGMNHFLLPGSRGPHDASFRYCEPAMAGLLRELELLGASRVRLRARIYGGARVLSGLSDLMHLGQRNVDGALAWLAERGVPVVERNVLGTRARRLEFGVSDGNARVRLLGAV
jgi:chemotaxis protein CheD